MRFFGYLMLSIACLVVIAASAKPVAPAPSKSCLQKKVDCLRTKFNFKSWSRGALSVSFFIDAMNGSLFLLAPEIANTVGGGLPAAPKSITQLLGVAFLGSAAGKFTSLSRQDSSLLAMHCRNALVPYCSLTATLLAVPFQSSQPTQALLKGAGAPLLASASLTAAHWKGSKDAP